MFRKMTSFSIPFLFLFSHRWLGWCWCILVNHEHVLRILLKPIGVMLRDIKLLKLSEHFGRGLYLEWFMMMHRFLFLVRRFCSIHQCRCSTITHVIIYPLFFVSGRETLAKEGEILFWAYFSALFNFYCSKVARYLHDRANVPQIKRHHYYC